LLEENEIALVVHDIDEYNVTYKEAKNKIEELNDKINEILSKTSTNQAVIEEVKTKLNSLNEELYNKQQELVRVSASVERLSGEKNLISERSKYNSEDMKLHDNILLLKEQLLQIENELKTIETNRDIDSKDNKELSDRLESIEKEISKEEENKANLVNDSNKYIRDLTLLKSKKEQLENDIESNSNLPFAVRSILANPKLIGIEGVIGKLFESLSEMIKDRTPFSAYIHGKSESGLNPIVGISSCDL